MVSFTVKAAVIFFVPVLKPRGFGWPERPSGPVALAWQQCLRAQTCTINEPLCASVQNLSFIPSFVTSSPSKNQQRVGGRKMVITQTKKQLKHCCNCRNHLNSESGSFTVCLQVCYQIYSDLQKFSPPLEHFCIL